MLTHENPYFVPIHGFLGTTVSCSLKFAKLCREGMVRRLTLWLVQQTSEGMYVTKIYYVVLHSYGVAGLDSGGFLLNQTLA